MKQKYIVHCQAILEIEVEASSVTEASRKFHKKIEPIKDSLKIESIDVQAATEKEKGDSNVL